MDHLLGALRASGEPTRLRILALLAQGELSVKELTRILGQSQPRVSRHLKLMCDAGLVMRLPEGTSVFYRLVDEGVSGGLACAITKLLTRSDATLQLDNSRLAEARQERNRRAAEYFSKNAAGWDRIRSLHVSEKAVESAIRQVLGARPVAHALDLGTGTGRTLLLLQGIAEKATGIDFNREMLAIARANLEAAGLNDFRVRLADVQNLPFADCSADLVTVHQLLHYLDNPAAAIREAARVLQPNGRLLIVDFAPHEIEQLRDVHAHRRLGFSEKEVTAWLQAAGLSLIEALHLPPSPDQELTVSIWLARNPGRAHTGRRKTGPAENSGGEQLT
ncbi:MAG TPA: metalloregulator ArsR/SmtB family transcription factor [Alphaproteobacteria bacterium]|nr:metalloregulator ArsR/SmtB family transcription factor [Alphaproteobacteria bacterium]